VWRVENLLWGLPILVDLVTDSSLLIRVGYRVNVNAILVAVRVKDIIGLKGVGASLLVAKNQVDPVTQLVRNVIAFKSLL
jgi:hypothetical protein